MILSPAIIALIAGSLLAAAYAVYASLFGLQIIQHWDIRSGSERQLALERRTSLISTVAAYMFGLTLFNAFLFVYTGDHVHTLFVGAMCAAGTLNANAYGYPLLVVKLINFFLCGLWLIVNHADGLAVDYPLIREKYSFLAALAAFLVIEALLTLNYFGLLEADVITSCCGSLFSTDAPALAGDLAALPAYGTKVVFFIGMALLLRCGIHFRVTGRGARLYGWLSTAMLAFGLAAVIAFISVHYYELPTHHCPFCLLQGDYHYIGYPLYLSLFGGGIAGAGAGLVDRFRDRPSLQAALPPLQKRLCLWSMVGFGIFSVMAAYPLVFSDFRLS
jgi:hypothetical protein